MNITEFLLARIAEDERKWGNPAFAPVAGVGLSELVLRMRAECEAKRRIVREHSDVDPCDAHDGATLEAVDCDTLRFLASVYADHEDFQEEWRV